MNIQRIGILFLAVALSLSCSCKGDGGIYGGGDEEDKGLLYYLFYFYNANYGTVNYNFNLTGAQEVPPVATAGTGTFLGVYTRANKTLSFTITWSSLSSNPTGAHFHGPAAVGSTASILKDESSLVTTTSGSATGSETLTSAQEADLLNGLWYINIHTVNNPSGEIRGQLIAQ